MRGGLLVHTGEKNCQGLSPRNAAMAIGESKGNVSSLTERPLWVKSRHLMAGSPTSAKCQKQTSDDALAGNGQSLSAPSEGLLNDNPSNVVLHVLSQLPRCVKPSAANSSMVACNGFMRSRLQQKGRRPKPTPMWHALKGSARQGEGTAERLS
jgi:hypothetical protein